MRLSIILANLASLCVCIVIARTIVGGVDPFTHTTFSKEIWSDARELEDPEISVLIKELKSVQKSSKASSTLSKYASSWKVWCVWSSSPLHIPEIPAKPQHVVLFLMEMFLSCIEKGTGSSALESALYAIRWAHRTAGLNSPTDHPVVQSTPEGVKTMLGRPVTGTPVGAAHLPKGATSNIQKMIFSKCPSR